MLTVVMGYGNRIRHVERKKGTTLEELDRYCKLLYIEHRSQEIYLLAEGRSHWVKPTFKMQVSGQQMRPVSVTYKRLEDHEVPKEIRMKHLMGAL